MKTTVHPLRLTLFIMAVTLCSVGSVFAQTCVVPPAGLLHWWPADGNAADAVGSNDGTPQNGTSFPVGLVGQAFHFDGMNDRVDLTSAVSPLGDLTIEAWVNPASFGQFDPINRLTVLHADNGVPVFGFGILSDINLSSIARRIDFVARDMSGNVLAVRGNSQLSAGTWTHVAWTWHAASRTGALYVNGAFENDGANASIDVSSLPQLLAIGATSRGPSTFMDHFHGLIDELTAYTRVLSAAEIAAIYAAGSAGKCKATTTAYSCTGFEPPFDAPILLKKKVNRSIPLQVQLFSDGTPITDTNIAGAAPVVNVTYSASTGPAVDVTDQLDPVGHSSEGNEFSYNPAAGHWIFQLGTKPFTAAGTYTVTVAPGDTSYTLSPTCTGQFVRPE